MARTIRLRGWKAVAALLIFAGVWAFGYWRMRSTLDSKAIETLKPWIVARFARDALREVGDRPIEQLSPRELDSLSRKLLAANRVEIKSIKAHGSGEGVVVRAEVLVDGRRPPDGKTVRYYSMDHSHLIGWTFRREVGPLSYWLALW